MADGSASYSRSVFRKRLSDGPGRHGLFSLTVVVRVQTVRVVDVHGMCGVHITIVEPATAIEPRGFGRPWIDHEMRMDPGPTKCQVDMCRTFVIAYVRDIGVQDNPWQCYGNPVVTA